MIDRLLLALLLIATGWTAYIILQRRFMRHASAVTTFRGRPSILYFRSDTCAPCKTQWRFLEQLQQQFGDEIAIEKIDADRERERAARYGIFTVPTTLIVDPDGTVRNTNFGLTPVRKLAAQIEDIAG